MEQRTTNPIPKTASVDAGNSQLRNIDPEEFTSQIQDTNSDAVIFPLIMLDAQGRVVEMNDAAISLTGFSLDDCLGRGLELFHAEGPVEFSAPNALLRSASRYGVVQRKLAIIHRNDARIPVNGCITALRQHDDDISKFAYVAIPEVSKALTSVSTFAETKSYEDNEIRRIILALIADGVVVTDQSRIITYLNPAAERMTGWSAVEAIGRPEQEVFCVTDESSSQLNSDATNNSAHLTDILALHSRNGKRREISQSVTPIRDKTGRLAGTVIVFRDITSFRQTEQQLRHQASHDPLTGLANRQEFEQRLGFLFENQQADERHAMLYVDLDQFKIINDTCGHDAGDELLRRLARILTGKVRDSDTVARLGGDEFGVILEGCSVGDAQRAAHQMLWAIEGFSFDWNDKKYELTASIGVSALSRGQSVAAA